MQYQIRCVEGEHKGAVIAIHPGEKVTVGRNPEVCNLIYTDCTISRVHCLIEVTTQGEWYVTDTSMSGIELVEQGEELPKTRTKIEPFTYLKIGLAGSVLQLCCQKEQ